jgi:DNA-binding NarL/FixJ family response regulator
VTTAPTSVLIVASQLVANGMGRLIDDADDLCVVGVATTTVAALRGLHRWQPAVVVVAEHLPDGAGLDTVAALHEGRPSLRTILVTDAQDPPAITCLPGTTIVSTNQPVGVLLTAIRGGPMIDLSDDALTDDPTAAHSMTARELEVLARLAGGASTGEIAAELFLSVNTVRNHIQHILEKLGSRSRLQAVTIALREGIVSVS